MDTKLVPTLESITYALRGRLRQATPEQTADAVLWYPEALHHAIELVPTLRAHYHEKCTVHHAAGVIAALSPRSRWETNKQAARQLCRGVIPKATLGRSIRKALEVIDVGPKCIKGRKSYNFYRAIIGDTDAIVVDSWICKACELGRDAPTKRQYDDIETAIRLLADEYGYNPRDLQAIVWIVERESPF